MILCLLYFNIFPVYNIYILYINISTPPYRGSVYIYTRGHIQYNRYLHGFNTIFFSSPLVLLLVQLITGGGVCDMTYTFFMIQNRFQLIRNRLLMVWNTLLRNGNTWCSYSWVCGYHSHITFPMESTQVVQGVGSVVWSMLCFTWLGLIIYLNLHLVKQTLILSLLIYKFIWKYSPFSQIWHCLYVISLDFTITILF